MLGAADKNRVTSGWRGGQVQGAIVLMTTLTRLTGFGGDTPSADSPHTPLELDRITVSIDISQFRTFRWYCVVSTALQASTAKMDR